MVIVIIILVVICWYFWSVKSDAQYELQKERNKIENFKILIDKTSELTKINFKNYSYSNDVCIYKKMGGISEKMIIIKVTLEKVYVSISLKDSKGNRNEKFLNYLLPINQLSVAESITAEFDYFERKLLEKNPNYYGE